MFLHKECVADRLLSPPPSSSQLRMTYDPRKTVDAPGSSPDRGMNAKNFVIIIIVSVVAFLVLIGALALHSSSSASAKPQAPTPDSRPSGPAPQ